MKLDRTDVTETSSTLSRPDKHHDVISSSDVSDAHDDMTQTDGAPLNVNAVSAELRQLPVLLPAHVSAANQQRFSINCGTDFDVIARFDSGAEISVFKPCHLPQEYETEMPFSSTALKGPFDLEGKKINAKLVNVAARLVNPKPSDPQPANCILTVAMTDELSGDEPLICTSDYLFLRRATQGVIPSVSVYSCDLVPVMK